MDTRPDQDTGDVTIHETRGVPQLTNANVENVDEFIKTMDQILGAAEHESLLVAARRVVAERDELRVRLDQELTDAAADGLALATYEKDERLARSYLGAEKGEGLVGAALRVIEERNQLRASAREIVRREFEAEITRLKAINRSLQLDAGAVPRLVEERTDMKRQIIQQAEMIDAGQELQDAAVDMIGALTRVGEWIEESAATPPTRDREMYDRPA